MALELSNFKCGHDAPIYTVIEEIVETSGTPYFSFKDIDENKPTGSIKIRTETIGYFLKRYEDRIVYGLSAYNAGYRIPNAAWEAKTVPKNYRYVEKVLDLYIEHHRTVWQDTETGELLATG